MKDKLKLTKKQTMIVIICLGILILVILLPTGKQDDDSGGSLEYAQTDEKAVVGDSLQEYVSYQEKRLKNIVGKIQGAGEVYVMITAKASREIVVEKDTSVSSDRSDETDSNGGARITENEMKQESTVMSSAQSGVSEPYIVKSLEPEIEGVVVAAQGADNPTVAQEIVNTVSVLFNVPSHKVKVVHME